MLAVLIPRAGGGGEGKKLEKFLAGFAGGVAAALWALIGLLASDGRRREQEEAALLADLDRLKTRLHAADEERRAGRRAA